MRLTLWDISDAQIEELDRSGKVSKDLTFYSPITGFVTDRKVFPQTSVTPETELYTVSDLSTVWAEAQIFENEVPYVHLGQKIVLTLSYVPGRTYTGKVSYIDPTVDAQTRSVRVRVQIANPRYALKPQMLLFRRRRSSTQARSRSSLSCMKEEFLSPAKSHSALLSMETLRC
jgi:Cu(I)/Ag(I) efflux system membrane fusion protein